MRLLDGCRDTWRDRLSAFERGWILICVTGTFFLLVVDVVNGSIP